MPTKPLEGGLLILITLSLSLGIFMNVLDTSIANVAIPNIAGDLGVSPDQGTWVITSFTVSMAIMLPLTGWLSRRFGEVKLFAVSTFLFTVTSMLCGFSEDFGMLVAFRVLQGAAAGPMIPLSQSLLLAIYPEEKQGFATGLWAMTAVVAPVFGPIMGGWITDNYSWPWIFFINLPVGLFSSIVVYILLSDRESRIEKRPIDIVGLLLLAIGVGCLQILLDNGKDLDWFNSNIIIILAIISFISLSIFIAWELTEEHPIVDLSLFARRNFSIGTLTLSLGYLIFFSNIVIFPLWLQTQMGYTPTWAGLASAPIGVIPIFLTPIIGRYMNRFDLRILVGISFIIFAYTSFWFASFYTDVGFDQLVIPRYIQGIALACFFTPLIAIVISGLPPERIASALGLSNFLRILGGSFGTSLSVTLWERRESFHQSHLVENINHYNPLSVQFFEKLQHLGLPDLNAAAFIEKVVIDQAFMLSTNDFFWLSGCLYLCLLGILLLAKPPFVSKGVHMHE